MGGRGDLKQLKITTTTKELLQLHLLFQIRPLLPGLLGIPGDGSRKPRRVSTLLGSYSTVPRLDRKEVL